MATIRKIGMLLAFSLWATVALGASQRTDAPAAQRQFQAWLEVFNGGDRAALQAYLRKNNPDRADHVDDELHFREMTGGFDFKKAEESVPTRYEDSVGQVLRRRGDIFGPAFDQRRLELKTLQDYVKLYGSRSRPPKVAND